MTEATIFYGCSDANLCKRVKFGSLPFKMDGHARLYALDKKFIVRSKNGTQKEKKITTTKPTKKIELLKPPKPEKKEKFEILTKEQFEDKVLKPLKDAVEKSEEQEDEDYCRAVPVPDSTLTDPVLVEEMVAIYATVTDSVRAKIQEYCIAYANYWKFYHMAHSKPLTKYGRINPLFQIVDAEFKRIEKLEKQLGIGLYAKKMIGGSDSPTASPFDEFFK